MRETMRKERPAGGRVRNAFGRRRPPRLGQRGLPEPAGAPPGLGEQAHRLDAKLIVSQFLQRLARGRTLPDKVFSSMSNVDQP